jgi:hypothetical protein
MFVLGSLGVARAAPTEEEASHEPDGENITDTRRAL